MSEVATLIADMVRAGVDAELIGRTAAALASREPVAVVDEQAERRRAKDRDRKRLRNSAESAESAEIDEAKKERSPTPPKEKTTPKENTPKGVQKKFPKAILEAVLSPAIAAAVVDHRAKIKKPLTDRASELLAKHLQAAPETCGLSPDQAADLMIYKGWQGFEPEWARNAVRSGYSAEPKIIRAITPDQELAPDVLEAEWQKRLSYARKSRSWFTAVWGPMPGKDGCRVPSKLLQPNDGQFPQGGDWLEQAPVRAA